MTAPRFGEHEANALAARLDTVRQALGAATLVAVCTERGVVFEADADIDDVPAGEVMFSNVRPSS